MTYFVDSVERGLSSHSIISSWLIYHIPWKPSSERSISSESIAHDGLRLTRGSPGLSPGSFEGGGDPAEASYAHRQQRNAAPRWEAP